MADKLDIVLFGATGFTGKNAIPNLERLARADGRSLTWGVAGRSEKKLKEALEEMSKRAGNDYSNVPIILADVKDEDSLKQMTSRCKILINTCGPYRFFGEAVIKACIETSTHHVDVSGEPQYMELMQLKYHEQAQEKGIYIVSACGFDSIPADLGVVFLQQKFGGTLNSVESYLEAKEIGGPRPGPAINYGTWESAVYGMAYGHELKAIRKQLYPKALPKFTPVLQPRGNFHKNKKVSQKWFLPFLGSDRSVIRRSQRHFYDVDKQRPVQIHTYFSVDNILLIVAMVFLGGIFSILCQFEFGRKLLLNYPKLFSMGFFTKEGPSYEKVENTMFCVTLCGKGWKDKLADANDTFSTAPNKEMIVKVSGKNPGYGATTVSVILAAITILNEKDKLPKKGGVYPPGAAFAKTSLIEQLNNNGVKFECL